MEQAKILLLPAPSEEVLAKAEMEINEFLETKIETRTLNTSTKWFEEGKTYTTSSTDTVETRTLNTSTKWFEEKIVDLSGIIQADEEPATATRTICPKHLRKRFVDEPVDLSEVVWSKEAIKMFVPMAPPKKRKRFEDEPVDLSEVVFSKEAIAMFVPMAPVKRKRF